MRRTSSGELCEVTCETYAESELEERCSSRCGGKHGLGELCGVYTAMEHSAGYFCLQPVAVAVCPLFGSNKCLLLKY